MTTQQQRDENKTNSYQQWEVDKLVDEKIKAAIKEYDDGLKLFLKTMMVLELFELKATAKFTKKITGVIGTTVGILVLGTLYQMFVFFVQSGNAK